MFIVDKICLCLSRYCFKKWYPVAILFAFQNAFGAVHNSPYRQYMVYHYQKSEYGGGNQNWDICSSNSGHVYIANNAGLLIAEGSKVNLFQLPAKTIIRSVALVGEKIYTGSFEEFGYWEANESGYYYHSLIPLLEINDMQNDEIWKIVEHEHKIYFQSFGKIFCYDGEKIIKIKIPGSVLFLLKAGNSLFVQQINGGLFTLEGLALKKIKGSDFFSDTEIKSVVAGKNGEFYIGTSSKGLFVHDKNGFREWDIEASSLLKECKINCGIAIAGGMAFGTILKGIIIIDWHGKIMHHLHSGNSMQNNTVLALNDDSEGNLWAGLDKGFDYIWLNSPIDKYIDPNMGLGSVYTSALYKEKLYLGTNQGIYYFDMDKIGEFVNSGLVNASQGQVWTLKIIDGILYGGLNSGTFIVTPKGLKRVGSENGGYNLVQVLVGEKEYYLQSTYSSIAVFEKQKDIWKQTRVIKGFMAPSRYLETDFLGNLILGHSITGIAMVQPSLHFDSVISVLKFDSTQGLNFKTNKIFKTDSRILTTDGLGFYQWDALKNRWLPFDELNQQLGEFRFSENIIPITADKYWFVNDNEIGMFEIRFGHAKLLYRIIPKMYEMNLVDKFENIVMLNDSLHLFCLEDGFAVLNMYKLNQLPELFHSPILKEAKFWRKQDKCLSVNTESKDRIEIRGSYNNFSISYATYGQSGPRCYFQYRLLGMDDTWSKWSLQSESTFYRLPSGKYTFEVRSMTVKGIETPVARFRFSVLPPFYLSYYAFFGYFIVFSSLIILLYVNYKRRKWKSLERKLKAENENIRKQKDEADRRLTQIANEKLQTEISLKNIQLAKSALFISQKNNVLQEIRNELNRQKSELGYRLPSKFYESLDRLIHKNSMNEHDWELFEHHFDQAHHDFFKRLKLQFPDLTPNDLRLCAYLKLNLSSKEIAPMLNITTRGVEEKRYRLRKRLNLNSEQGLTDFIMAF